MVKTFYKVVRRQHEFSPVHKVRLVSFIHDSLPDKFSTEYKVNKFVKPRVKGTYLYVFGNLKDAQSFASGSVDYEIYECEAKNARKAPYLASIGINMQFVERFWNLAIRLKKQRKSIFTLIKDNMYGLYVDDKSVSVKTSPRDTYMAKEVKLLRKVG